MNGSTQLHDFEPGIAPNGVFWTVPVPPDSVQVSPGAGTARFRMTDVAVPDYGDFFSAVTGGPAVPGRVSFDVRWSGDGGRTTVRDAANGFVETLVEGTASVSWSATNANGYRYETTGASSQTTLYAAVGHERNGVFLRS